MFYCCFFVKFQNSQIGICVFEIYISLNLLKMIIMNKVYKEEISISLWFVKCCNKFF